MSHRPARPHRRHAARTQGSNRPRTERLEDRQLLTATLSTLVDFNSTNGANPGNAGLVADGSGNLYGTTTTGGTGGDGTVFELAAVTHQLTTLVNFDGTNGDKPFAGLTIDSAGNLYGTTYIGGADNDGTVFEITASGHAFSTIATFDGTDGSAPQAPMYLDGSGNLFGTTWGQGPDYTGSAGDYGVVYEVPASAHSASTNPTVLQALDPTVGYHSTSPLTADSAGNLYGTTTTGGANSDGTLFKLAAGTHAFSVVLAFAGGSGGESPWGGVIIDGSNNMFGTTQNGGSADDGTVYEVDAGTSVETTLASFSSANNSGENPLNGLIEDSAGDLFGTTNAGAGTVFEVVAGSHALQTVYAFTAGTAPYGAFDELYADSSGDLIAASQAGGPAYTSTFSGYGAVYELTNTGFVVPTVTATAAAAQSATATVAHTFSLGSFTEAYATAPYTVTVNWGDGTANTSFSMSGTGTITPQSHTYAAGGSDTVSVTVTDSAGHTSGAKTFTATVAAAPSVTMGTVGNAAATAGVTTTVALGSFSEVNATAPYTVTVDWGDGTANTTFSMSAAGTVTPQSHKYTTAGTYAASVVVADAAGHTSNTATFTATVVPPAQTLLVVTPPAGQSATAEASQSFALGSFTAANATAPYTVSVNWGDASAATTFTATGTGTLAPQPHTYAAAGSDTVSVTVTDAAGHTSNTATFTATVAPAPAATVTVHVYVADATGQATSSDTPVVGREVFLDLNGTGSLAPNDPTATTNSAGTATLSLADATGSTALIGEVVPAGYGQTEPTSGEATVSTTAASTVTFGNLQLVAAAVASGSSFVKYALPNVSALGSTVDAAKAVTEPDGKLLVAGTDASGAFVARDFPDGTPDLNFGSAGIAPATDGLTGTVPDGLIVQPGGDVVVVGTSTNPTNGAVTYYAVRLLPSGAVDSTFGWQSAAGAVFAAPSAAGGITGVTQLTDGSLLVTGGADPAGNGQFEAAALDLSATTGQPVTTFGTAGVAGYGAPAGLSADGSTPVGPALVLPDGGFDLVADNDGGSYSIATFSTTGAAGASFQLPAAFSAAGYAQVTAAVDASDGDVVVAGLQGATIEVARLSPGGSLDTTFGTAGTGLITPDDLSAQLPAGTVFLSDSEVLANGSVLVTGGYRPTDGSVTQFFCQDYSSAGALTLGLGTANPLEVAGDGVDETGASLIKASGVLPTVTAAAPAAGVAAPAVSATGVGFVPTIAITTGAGVGDLFIETSPVTATLTAPTAIAATSSTPEYLYVNYTDSIAVELDTLGAGNLTVAPPAGAGGDGVTYLGTVSDVAGTNVTAEYAVLPTGGTWTAADDGAYTVSLAGNQVQNTNPTLYAAAVADFGTFDVTISPLSAALATVPAVTAATTAPITLTVTYTDASAAVAAASIGTADLTVANSTGTISLAVTGATAATAVGDTLVVTYTVSAPAGGFVAGDNGIYTVSQAAGQVTDANGSAAPAVALGTFDVAIGGSVTLLSSTVAVAVLVPSVDSGNVLVFTATVTGVAGTVLPTGTVTFADAAGTLGTATVGSDGKATYSTAALPADTYTVTATYSGDSTYGSSTSAAGVAATVVGPGAGESALTPSASAVTVPAALVAGGTLQFTGPVVITNTGQGKASGLVTVVVYASTDSSLDIDDVSVETFRIKLGLGVGKAAKVKVPTHALPSNLAAGTYHLLMQVVDAHGFAQTAATVGTVVVAAPFVAPTVTLGKATTQVATALLHPGRNASATVSIGNTGNIAIAGPVTVTLYLTADGVVDANSIKLGSSTHPLAVKPGKLKPAAVKFTVPEVTAGEVLSLAAVVTTASGATATAVDALPV
jgi:uncharacterized repeat protein (TIGR03803 family)